MSISINAVTLGGKIDAVFENNGQYGPSIEFRLQVIAGKKKNPNGEGFVTNYVTAKVKLSNEAALAWAGLIVKGDIVTVTGEVSVNAYHKKDKQTGDFVLDANGEPEIVSMLEVKSPRIMIVGAQGIVKPAYADNGNGGQDNGGGQGGNYGNRQGGNGGGNANRGQGGQGGNGGGNYQAPRGNGGQGGQAPRGNYNNRAPQYAPPVENGSDAGDMGNYVEPAQPHTQQGQVQPTQGGRFNGGRGSGRNTGR